MKNKTKAVLERENEILRKHLAEISEVLFGDKALDNPYYTIGFARGIADNALKIKTVEDLEIAELYYN